MPRDAVIESCFYDPDSRTLLNPTAISRMHTEMAFAFAHKIRWEMVDMFIDHVGGYELISANNLQWDLPCATMQWADVLKETPGVVSA